MKEIIGNHFSMILAFLLCVFFGAMAFYTRQAEFLALIPSVLMGFFALTKSPASKPAPTQTINTKSVQNANTEINPNADDLAGAEISPGADPGIDPAQSKSLIN